MEQFFGTDYCPRLDTGISTAQQRNLHQPSLHRPVDSESPVRSMLLDHGISLSKLQSAPIKPAAPETKTKRKVTTWPMAAIEVSGDSPGIAGPPPPSVVIWHGHRLCPTSHLQSFSLSPSPGLYRYVYTNSDMPLLPTSLAMIRSTNVAISRSTPCAMLDPFISIVLPLVFLMLNGLGLPGGAVYIDRSRIKDGWRHSLVALAGPLANALVVAILDNSPAHPTRDQGRAFRFLVGCYLPALPRNHRDFFNLIPCRRWMALTFWRPFCRTRCRDWSIRCANGVSSF